MSLANLPTLASEWIGPLSDIVLLMTKLINRKMSVETELMNRLLDISRAVVEECKRLKTEGITKQAIPHLRYVVDFEYRDGRITSLAENAEEVIKQQFGTSNIEIALLRHRLFSLWDRDELDTCLNLVAETCSIQKSEATTIISQFSQNLAYNILDKDNISEEFLREFISPFIQSLGKEPDWKIKIWLSGVWVAESEIRLMENVILRQPVPSDFEREIPVDDLPKLPLHYEDIEFTNVMAILEIVLHHTSHNQMETKLRDFTNLLTIFRLGEIKFIKRTASPSRYIGQYSYPIIAESGYINPLHVYEITRADSEVFLQFYTHLGSQVGELTRNDDFLGIAYDRYTDALSGKLAEYSIASAINCLEALFLDDNSGELAHKLSQRVAAIIRQRTAVPGPEIYKLMKDAYTVRSKYVHGVVSRKKPKTMPIRELRNSILEYSRKSLLVFLQIKGYKSKSEFLKLIDDSLLDETAQAELLDLLNDVIVT